MPTSGDLKVINYEAVLKLKPDVVIVMNYIPQEYIDKMTELKIPVVAVSFQRSDTKGFYDGIELLGKVTNREKEAAELISFVKTSQEQLKAKISDFIVDKRPKIYMANPG